MFLRKILLALCLPAFLSGCGMIPASGPYSAHIKQGSRAAITISSLKKGNHNFRYALAEIDPNLLDYVASEEKKAPDNFIWPANEPADEITVNVGDTIQLSIFESQSGGLFIPEDSSVRPGNFVSLPPQTIDSTGEVSVPYAGKVSVAGKTTQQISQIIEERLSNKAIEPQVVVSFSNRAGAEVSVIGDVNNARRLSLGFNKYRILDVIASAGGPVSPGYETKVSLQRAEKEYTIPFDQLILNAEKNIYSKINDILYLYREPQTFTAYGAVESQGNIPFGKRKLVLSEALGLTQGLRDTQADPAEIYIYRQRKYPYFKNNKISKEKPIFKVKSEDKLEPAFKTYSKIGGGNKSKELLKLQPETKTEEMIAEVESEDISVIFKLDMRKPSSFFLAQSFMMEDQDVIYVANAESVEFLKFLNIINSSSVTKVNTDTAF